MKRHAVSVVFVCIAILLGIILSRWPQGKASGPATPPVPTDARPAQGGSLHS